MIDTKAIEERAQRWFGGSVPCHTRVKECEQDIPALLSAVKEKDAEIEVLKEMVKSSNI